MKNRNLPLKIATAFLMFSFASVTAQDFKTIIKNHLAANGSASKSTTEDFTVIVEDYSKAMNADVVKVQQSYNGIPIFNATATALIKEKKVNYFIDSFVKNYKVAATEKTAQPSRSIFEKVGKNFGLKNIAEYQMLSFNDADLDGTPFAKTQVVYFQTERGDLRLSQQYMFEEKETSDYWNVVAATL